MERQCQVFPYIEAGTYDLLFYLDGKLLSRAKPPQLTVFEPDAA